MAKCFMRSFNVLSPLDIVIAGGLQERSLSVLGLDLCLGWAFDSDYGFGLGLERVFSSLRSSDLDLCFGSDSDMGLD